MEHSWAPKVSIAFGDLRRDLISNAQAMSLGYRAVGTFYCSPNPSHVNTNTTTSMTADPPGFRAVSSVPETDRFSADVQYERKLLNYLWKVSLYHGAESLLRFNLTLDV